MTEPETSAPIPASPVVVPVRLVFDRLRPDGPAVETTLTARMVLLPGEREWRSMEVFATHVGNDAYAWHGRGETYHRALRLPPADPAHPAAGPVQARAVPIAVGSDELRVYETRIPQVDPLLDYWIFAPSESAPSTTKDPVHHDDQVLTIEDVQAAYAHAAALAPTPQPTAAAPSGASGSVEELLFGSVTGSLYPETCSAAACACHRAPPYGLGARVRVRHHDRFGRRAPLGLGGSAGIVREILAYRHSERGDGHWLFGVEIDDLIEDLGDHELLDADVLEAPVAATPADIVDGAERAALEATVVYRAEPGSDRILADEAGQLRPIVTSAGARPTAWSGDERERTGVAFAILRDHADLDGMYEVAGTPLAIAFRAALLAGDDAPLALEAADIDDFLRDAGFRRIAPGRWRTPQGDGGWVDPVADHDADPVAEPVVRYGFREASDGVTRELVAHGVSGGVRPVTICEGTGVPMRDPRAFAGSRPTERALVWQERVAASILRDIAGLAGRTRLDPAHVACTEGTGITHSTVARALAAECISGGFELDLPSEAVFDFLVGHGFPTHASMIRLPSAGT